MDSIEYDVVIVGAGPVGGFLAQRMSEGGVSVLLLEEHAQIGRPFQCAGQVVQHAEAGKEGQGDL